MADVGQNEDIQLRSVALQNAKSILSARERAERALADAKQALQAKTGELASSLALVQATLEATPDAILVTDANGKITNYNRKYVEMWGIPGEIMETNDHDVLQNICSKHLHDPWEYISRTREIYGASPSDSFDLLRLIDGRVIERTSTIQHVGSRNVGRVWNFRDITKRTNTEKAVAQQQDWFRVTLRSIGDAVITTDIHGKVIFLNPMAEALTGWTFEQALDQPIQTIFNIIHEDATHPEQFIEKIKFLVSHPREIDRDEIVCKAGAILARYSAPVTGKDGNCHGRIWSFRDITERKQAEAELAYERDLLRSLLDNSPDHIYFKDIESRFLKSNKAQAINFGLRSADELVGKTDFDFLTEEHARPAFEDEVEIIRTGNPLVGRVEKEVLKDGRVAWVLTSKMPLRNKGGEIIGTFGISKDITAIKEAEKQLAQVNKQLIETSRQAGMAEVATSVLHNVGNVLNSVNVSSTLVSDQVRRSKVANLSKVVALLNEHATDIGIFLTSDPKGKQLPGYLGHLAEHLVSEQNTVLKELKLLHENIEHINDIVVMQQSYAKVSGIVETVKINDLVEDALRMNLGGLIRHGVEVLREYEDVPSMDVEKHKILQILVNLVRNAKSACDESLRTDKRMTLRVTKSDGQVKIAIIDNGIGIPAENLTRIFNRGFTTRKDGHGFGLHNSALTAIEMRGALRVHSDGVNQGATFTLELPYKPHEAA